MRLYLVRHGIAVDRADPGCPPDEERPLTPEGIEKTRKVCRGLFEMGTIPDAVLTSPLVRAVQTAEIACEVLGFPRQKIMRVDSLRPGGNPAEFSSAVRKLKAEEIMCFGHAPQLDHLIAHLTGAHAPFTALKKAGVACIEVQAASAPRATLLWLAPPKILRRMA